MVSATKTHLEVTLTNLRREAVLAGLMGEDESLSFEKANRVAGTTANLWVGHRGTHAPFVPRFTMRHTQREQILMMESVAYALHTLRMTNLAKSPKESAQ